MLPSDLDGISVYEHFDDIHTYAESEAEHIKRSKRLSDMEKSRCITGLRSYPPGYTKIRILTIAP